MGICEKVKHKDWWQIKVEVHRYIGGVHLGVQVNTDVHVCGCVTLVNCVCSGMFKWDLCTLVKTPMGVAVVYCTLYSKQETQRCSRSSRRLICRTDKSDTQRSRRAASAFFRTQRKLTSRVLLHSADRELDWRPTWGGQTHKPGASPLIGCVQNGWLQIYATVQKFGVTRQFHVFHENALLFIKWISKWIEHIVKTLTRFEFLGFLFEILIFIPQTCRSKKASFIASLTSITVFSCANVKKGFLTLRYSSKEIRQCTIRTLEIGLYTHTHIYIYILGLWND